MSFSVQTIGRDKAAIKTDLGAKLTTALGSGQASLAAALTTAIGALVDNVTQPEASAIRVESNGHFTAGAGSLSLAINVLPASHFADWPAAPAASSTADAAAAGSQASGAS